jgi:hypothetical protein
VATGSEVSFGYLVWVTHIFYFYFAFERRNEMFGKMNIVPVVDLRNTPDEVGRCSDGAVKRLLDAAEHPKIERWIQFPQALLVFLVVPGDPQSGAFYVYIRRSRIWYWADFDDEKFGGYSVSDFDRLVREGRFLDLVERPRLFAEKWVVELGSRPRRSGEAATATVKAPQ